MEWSGYKVHVTETCDEDAAHLVTHVKACPAMEGLRGTLCSLVR